MIKFPFKSTCTNVPTHNSKERCFGDECEDVSVTRLIDGKQQPRDGATGGVLLQVVWRVDDLPWRVVTVLYYHLRVLCCQFKQFVSISRCVGNVNFVHIFIIHLATAECDTAP